VAQKFFGQVWGNSGKNPSQPQKLTCSYTYVVHWTWYSNGFGCIAIYCVCHPNDY